MALYGVGGGATEGRWGLSGAGTTEDFTCLTEPGIDHDCRNPESGWPASEELFPIGNPTHLLRHRIFNAGNLRGLPKDHVVTREVNLDHMSVALDAAGAIQEKPQEFRFMNGEGNSGRPPVGRKYKVREHSCHNWRMGVRLGPDVNISPHKTPIRNSRLRGGFAERQ